MFSFSLVLGAAIAQQSDSPIPDDGFGRPPLLERRDHLRNPRDTLVGPVPPAAGPDGDDVQVSSPSNGNQNEMVIRVDPTDRDHLIGGANDNRSGTYTCAFYSSLDGGHNWSEFFYNTVEHSAAGDPAAAIGPNGETYFCALEFGGSSSIYVGESFDGGASVPSFTRAIGNRNHFEDKQFLVADTSQGPLSGNLYVSWTRFRNGFSNNPIYVITSADQGLSWTRAQRVSDSTNCQGSCPAVGPNSELYVTFFDFNTEQMMIDKSLDGGATWGTDVVIGPSNCSLNNAPFRHFCFPACSVDLSGGPYHGHVYAVYSTFVPAEGSNDVVLYRSADGGQTWDGPVDVSDEPTDASQFFPWIDVDANGNVNVGYYDRRSGDDSDTRIRYRVSRSSDGGQSFQPSVGVGDVTFNPFNYGDGFFIGDYTGLAASDRSVHPLWTDGRNDTNDTFTSRVDLSLFSDADSVSAATGAVVNFNLNAGPLYQGRSYRLLGSISGTDPGLTFGNGLNLPLNNDLFFNLTLLQANNAVFQDFSGVLDAEGSATPSLDTQGPIPAGLIGVQMDFAALVFAGGPQWASAATSLVIDP